MMVSVFAKGFYRVAGLRPVDPEFDKRRQKQQYELRVKRLDVEFDKRVTKLFDAATREGAVEGHGRPPAIASSTGRRAWRRTSTPRAPASPRTAPTARSRRARRSRRTTRTCSRSWTRRWRSRNGSTGASIVKRCAGAIPSFVLFPCSPRPYNSPCRSRCRPCPLVHCMPAAQLSSARPRRVAVLGSTGSIGTSTLDVIRHLPDRLELAGLAAHSKWELLAEQCREFPPRLAVIADPEAFARADRTEFPRQTELLCGPDGIAKLVSASDVDVVLSAIVGAAGLNGTWAALEAGKTVALANKETLVVGGPLVMDLAARHGAKVLPVDSEHSAIFQALAGHSPKEVARVVLTASGGPFRGTARGRTGGCDARAGAAASRPGRWGRRSRSTPLP